MIVVCIDNKYEIDGIIHRMDCIIINKHYICIPSFGYRGLECNYHTIIDEYGIEFNCDDKFFITLEEYRSNQIDKIL